MKAGVAGGLFLAAMPFSALAADGVLEEIVVTAQKREQGLQEVPVSVATVTDEQIAAMFSGGEDILTLANRVPGLYAESSNGRGAPRFYIRGLGNVDFDLAASQPVSVIMDDIVMENVTLKSFPLFDVDRVEVIRGPQGTLFGRNTTAGIIKFDTVKPSDENDAFAALTVGRLGMKKIEAAFGGSMGDNMSGRLSFLYNGRDDWVSNGFTNEEDVMGHFDEAAIRLQTNINFTDNLSGLFSYQVRDFEGTSSFFRANVFTTGQAGLNENYTRDLVFYDDGDGNPQSIETDILSAKFEYERDNKTFTYIIGYTDTQYSAKGDIDGGFVDFATGNSGPGFIPFGAVTEDQADTSQLTQEFRITSVEEDLTWQVGAFFYESDLEVTTIDGFFGTTSVNHTNTAWAIFGQAELDFTDRMTLIGGLRYTSDEKGLSVGQQNVDGFALVIGAASIQDYEDVSVDDNEISWEGSVNYKLDNASVYARLANGFRAQSIQARDVAFEGLPSVADSENIFSFEIGYKANLANDRARINAAVFWYDVDDLQLSAIGGANNGNSLLNADSGIGKGFEVDVEWLMTDRLLVTGGFALADTEIQDEGLETAVCGSGACTVRDPVNGTLANIDGNPFQAAPRTTANIAISYTAPLPGGELAFFTDWTFQGKTQMSLYEAVEFETNEQFEGSLRIAYRSQNGWEVGVFGRNITDEDNIKGFIDFNNNTGFVNEPRLYGVDFRYNFFQ